MSKLANSGINKQRIHWTVLLFCNSWQHCWHYYFHQIIVLWSENNFTLQIWIRMWPDLSSYIWPGPALAGFQNSQIQYNPYILKVASFLSPVQCQWLGHQSICITEYVEYWRQSEASGRPCHKSTVKYAWWRQCYFSPVRIKSERNRFPADWNPFRRKILTMMILP